MPLFGPNIWWLKTRSNVKGLSKALSHKNYEIRAKAADALGDLGDKAAVESLRSALLYDSEGRVRQAAAYALGDIGAEEAISPLCRAIEDQDNYVRSAAAMSLGKLGGPQAVAALIKAQGDTAENVRKTVTNALNKLGPTIVDGLMTTLKEGDVKARSLAAVALGKQGGEQIVEPLLAALKDDSADVRNAVATVLGTLGETRAITPLTELISDSQCRDTAVTVLGKLGWQPDTEEHTIWYKIAKKDWDQCVAALKHDDTRIRRAAIEALDLQKTEATDLLIEVINSDTNPQVVLAAIKAVAETGHARAVQPILNKLFVLDSQYLSTIGAALRKFTDQTPIVDFLIPLVKQNGDKQARAIRLLGELGAQQAEDDLLSLLGSPPPLDAIVMYALGDIGGERSLERLVAIAESQENWEDRRVAALKALAHHVPKDRRVARLVEALAMGGGEWSSKVVSEARQIDRVYRRF
ncbi:MAG: HEAT repeat domain-containing protein [Anaerolineae bacterium]|nr:HEAT repeat domain-containing protein [Anaerolineae bacterium]